MSHRAAQASLTLLRQWCVCEVTPATRRHHQGSRADAPRSHPHPKQKHGDSAERSFAALILPSTAAARRFDKQGMDGTLYGRRAVVPRKRKSFHVAYLRD